MVKRKFHILLAEDDLDDIYFFEQALEAFPIDTKLSTLQNGELLMNNLKELYNQLPNVLFLDLNMPRKNGFECLTEIKKNKLFRQLPIVIFSTSFELGVVNTLYEKGAQYYIRKPADIRLYKMIIKQALNLIVNNQSVSNTKLLQPARTDFVLTLENISC
jgi:CheY-like chemotaxis protein